MTTPRRVTVRLTLDDLGCLRATVKTRIDEVERRIRVTKSGAISTSDLPMLERFLAQLQSCLIALTGVR